jgi:hypothetical protein
MRHGERGWPWTGSKTPTDGARAFDPTRAARIVCIVALMALIAGGCGSGSTNSAAATQTLDLDASSLYPQSTVEDLVSYGDVLVAATVTEIVVEEEPQLEEGEGYLRFRQINAAVDEILWRGGPSVEVPESASWLHLPFVLSGGEEPREGRIGGAPWLSEGDEILAVLVRADGEWGPTNVEAVFLLDDGVPVWPEEGIGDVFFDDLRGLDVAGVVELFEQTTPDPVADRNRDLEPPARYQATRNE